MAPLPLNLEVRVDRASDLPLGAQLARALRDWIATSAPPGTRLPSVRELAAEAGVNVNTARAVYQRLESEGLVSSEQGRGTFVAKPGRAGDGGSAPAGGRGEAAERAELRRQIALLERELARRPPIEADPFAPTERQPARLMTAEALREVRDDLLVRLQGLDEARAEVLARLAELDAEDRIADAEEAAAETARRTQRPQVEDRHSTVSVPGARVRWVGA